MRDLKTWGILSVSLVCISIATPVIAGIPTDRIRQTADQVLVILQDPRLKSESSQKERREQLRQTISARFDFGEMAKRSLGPTSLAARHPGGTAGIRHVVHRSFAVLIMPIKSRLTMAKRSFTRGRTRTKIPPRWIPK